MADEPSTVTPHARLIRKDTPNAAREADGTRIALPHPPTLRKLKTRPPKMPRRPRCPQTKRSRPFASLLPQQTTYSLTRVAEPLFPGIFPCRGVWAAVESAASGRLSRGWR